MAKFSIQSLERGKFSVLPRSFCSDYNFTLYIGKISSITIIWKITRDMEYVLE